MAFKLFKKWFPESSKLIRLPDSWLNGWTTLYMIFGSVLSGFSFQELMWNQGPKSFSVGTTNVLGLFFTFVFFLIIDRITAEHEKMKKEIIDLEWQLNDRNREIKNLEMEAEWEKKARGISSPDPCQPALFIPRLCGDFAERFVVTNANVHHARNVHSDQSGQREAVRINHDVHACRFFRFTL
jgi:hypothetical protein